MIFQKFFNQTNKEEEKDIFDQLKYIVSLLLNREVPSSNMNQLILNINIKIQELAHTAKYHRSQIDMYTAVGVFHKEAYEKTIKHQNQLQLLLDNYITLNIEEERPFMNHRLRFYDQKIAKLYREIEGYHHHAFLPELEELFWNAVKEDCVAILASLY